MSRRYPSSYYRDGGIKPYQPTTVPIHRYTTAVDTGLSDGTFTDSQIYEYYEDVNCYPNYHHDYPHSSGSGSIRIPTFDQNTHHFNRGSSKKYRVYPNVDTRIYPNSSDRLYQEIPTQAPPPKLIERPQSSLSSGVTSAIVDGCGGKCQTFENVCYFFLQLVFMMGILIGISLSIAGLVLRKSAARNLQVLVYIGVLLAIVSAGLLGIQWNARNVAKRRKSAIKNAKRAPIPLETLNIRQQQPLVVNVPPPVVEQPGIPWWRRKDLV